MGGGALLMNSVGYMLGKIWAMFCVIFETILTGTVSTKLFLGGLLKTGAVIIVITTRKRSPCQFLEKRFQLLVYLPPLIEVYVQCQQSVRRCYMCVRNLGV